EKQSEEAVKSSLKEKEILLRELNHRTKNNMQVISSLLQLQAASTGNENMQQIFNETQNRIRALSLVHDKLQSARTLASINIREYIGELARLLLKSYEKRPGMISLKLDIDEIPLPMDVITPCGLILNELISNSLKYAFPGDRPGEIRISLHRTGGSGIAFSFSDNGIGLPEDFRNKRSLGLRLVRRITAKQLDGKLDIIMGDGAKFDITFNITG
ncbi:MAG: sensor histidine kinase, partial [Nitrospiraceae bacterium]|nr:sensor histidine kinase [Nitrospiraceae bacterium]